MPRSHTQQLELAVARDRALYHQFKGYKRLQLEISQRQSIGEPVIFIIFRSFPLINFIYLTNHAQLSSSWSIQATFCNYLSVSLFPIQLYILVKLGSVVTTSYHVLQSLSSRLGNSKFIIFFESSSCTCITFSRPFRIVAGPLPHIIAFAWICHLKSTLCIVFVSLVLTYVISISNTLQKNSGTSTSNVGHCKTLNRYILLDNL